ncbi:hypothetical protein [Streptomyces sp. NPDC006307]|uniref:hypothetical protein n=1 Tax=Streptomyces sp. NPDC006307 TaxID=3156748 RepID=UPI0033B43E78
MRRAYGGFAAACAAVLLLAGCGTKSGGGGDRPPEQAPALTEEQARAALPDGAAMPGWKATLEPTATAMNDLYKSEACPTNGNQGCDDARFYGVSTFRRADGKAGADFRLVAYGSEKAAEAAYDTLWRLYAPKAGPTARKVDLGGPGDRGDAVLGTYGYQGGPGGVAQVRVGTALLWVEATGAREGDLDAALVKDLASRFAERAREAG